MTLPSLPASGSTSWYSHYTGLHNAASGALSEAVSVKHPDYGATGNGSTDDTAAINAAITANAGKTVYVPPGTYMINTTLATGATGQPVGIKLNQAKTRLELAPGAILKAIANNATNYAIIQVTAADCVISGGTFQGDVSTHTGSTGEWGHCIDINTGADRCLVVNTLAKEAWGDGVSIYGRPSDVTLLNVTALNCRRLGGSIIDAIRPRLYNCHFGGTGSIASTGPIGGLDIEPDPSSTRDVIDALVVGCLFENNGGPGFNASANGRTLSATIVGCRSTGNGGTSSWDHGYYINGINGSASNFVNIIGCDALGNTTDGFYIEGGTSNVRVVACTSRGNDRFGFTEAGGSNNTFQSCSSDDNGGSGFYTETTASNTNLTDCLARGNGSTGTFRQQFHINGPTGRLVGCLADPGGYASSTYGYTFTSTATGSKLVGCQTRGSFVTGDVLDQTSGILQFPKPGAARQSAITSPSADVTSLKTAVDAIRTALTAMGVTA